MAMIEKKKEGINLQFPLPILILQESEAEHEVLALSLKACQGQQGMAGSQMQDGGATSKQVGISLPGTVFCVPVKFVSPWEEATMAVAHSEHTITLVLIMIIYN